MGLSAMLHRHPDKARARGYTLIELVIAMSITSILLVSIGSAVVLASKALPGAGNTADAVIDVAAVSGDIAGELEYALSFSQRTATAVTFTVADRDNDQVDETIRYAWSGTAGDPLTRQYNGPPAVAVIGDVSSFQLEYDTIDVTEQQPSEVESGEVLLASAPTTGTGSGLGVTGATWLGQYFLPTLPADAISWQIGRILIRARISGPIDGAADVRLRPVDGSGLPLPYVMDQATVDEASLGPAFEWRELTFDGGVALPPGWGLSFTIECDTIDPPPMEVELDAGSGLLQSVDGGQTWTSLPSICTIFYVYGTHTTPGPPVDVDRTYLTGVRFTLATGSGISEVQTGVSLLEAPEIQP